MNKLSEIWGNIYSACVALLRLIFLTLALFASGVHVVLFTRTEVCNIEMRGIAWRCDREKIGDQMSFVDKLCLDNPELLDYADEQMGKNGDLPNIDDDDEED